ncbi:fructose-bisphosphatase class III [Gilvimarinus xylanilyticus]|uniref:Fructose-1,6-bisphosphatase n=1 Tax=Gilvimarinus xylanilyticus TaxID=2944139 RepID=A0A9X2HTP8_9GAMM|nr:fructose-bisphosphatase class III [Gilvimarinus xylanilyticus]MCP8898075.1 fructose-1,6-bisphosphatase [Gilvimarinus xylanilyticus]
MSTQPYKVFISDLHGQGDVFDSLEKQRFGVVETLLIDYLNEYPQAPREALRHYLLGESLARSGSFDHFQNLIAMMEILLKFKQDRRFWPVGVETFSSCSWFLNVLDEFAITGVLDDQRREAIALLDDQDREQLCRYIAKAVLALVSYRLHVVGDIFDRGPDAAHILDRLEQLPRVNVQWGNHDVLWMGAASGSLECIATVIRLCLKYGHTETLTQDYDISLDKLADFASKAYGCDSCANFSTPLSDSTGRPWSAMHKAIAIIQFKLEEQIIERNTNFAMEARAMLRKVDYARGVVALDNAEVSLTDTAFPTVNPNSTSSLTDEEWRIVEDLKLQFVQSERLHQHINFLFANGSLLGADEQYTMYHGCLPVTEDLQLAAFRVNDRALEGRALFDAFELQLRKAYSRRKSTSCQYLSDIAWYLWCGPQSPLFGRQKMTTFERYFVADKKYHREGNNPYFSARNSLSFVGKVARELRGDGNSILVNGHVPVKLKDGESPRYADGRLICIDGGFSKAYRSKTGAAGMVLVANECRNYLFSIQQDNSGFRFHAI